MKKLWVLLALCLLLTACGAAPQPAAPAASSEEEAVETPLVLEELRVEFLRSGTDKALLLRAVKELPGELKTALHEAGVTVDEVTVTMSGSSASTAQAAEEGGVDLAFLPVEELVRAQADPHVLLLAGERRMALYTTGTDYGRNLSARTDPTWEELDHARWGVVAGEEAVNVWLADHYEGNTLSDLTAVTEYPDREALLSAAEAGEVDLFCGEEAAGYAVLAELEPFYTYAAVVTEADGRLAEALLSALETVQKGDFAPLFGTEPYQAARDEDLDPQRRLASIAG